MRRPAIIKAPISRPSTSDGAEAPLRALEIGSSVSLSFAGALLTSVGWDVVKVEPPGTGDTLRRRHPLGDRLESQGESLFFTALSRGKRSLACDVGSSVGASVVAAASASAQVSLITAAARAELEKSLSSEGKKRVLNSASVITVADFGEGGPYTNWAMSDLEWAALTGLAHATPPGPLEDGELGEPLKPGPDLYEPTMGIVVASAAVALALGHGGHNDGEAQHEIRINQHEVAVSLPILENVFSFLALGENSPRGSARMRYAPLALMRCRDGWVYIQCHDEATWDRFVAAMGSPAWTEEERFSDRFHRFTHWHELKPHLDQWLSQRTRTQVFEIAKGAGLPFAPVQDMRDVATSRHAKHRELFTTICASDGQHVKAPRLFPYVAGVGFSELGCAPRVGEHSAEILGTLAGIDDDVVDALERAKVVSCATQSSSNPRRTHGVRAGGFSRPPLAPRGPSGRKAQTVGNLGWETALANLRVLDFSMIWAGPWVTRFLASAGADVVKVESSHHPDFTRTVPPLMSGLGPLNAGIEHQIQNRGKKSVALNLKNDRAREVARRLAASCDVVVENFRPGVAARLGIGFDDLRSVNPDLIMLSLSGYGAAGPDSLTGAAGSAILAYSGTVSLTGYDASRPHTLGTSWPDQAGGLAGAFCILAALQRRAHGNAEVATHVDLGLNDVMVSLLSEPFVEYLNGGMVPAPQGNGASGAILRGCLRADGDDSWLAVSVTDVAELDAAINFLNSEGVFADTYDPVAQTWDEYIETIWTCLSAWAAERRPDTAAAELQAWGIRAAPVLDGKGVVEDLHLRARGYWEESPHPQGGVMILPKYSLIEGLADTISPARALGADTGTVCQEWLGMSESEWTSLQAEGIFE